jgi:general secretion pathway protein G
MWPERLLDWGKRCLQDDSKVRSWCGHMEPLIPSRDARSVGRRVRSYAGFTLIELLIVLSITVILVSIGIPLYQKSILRTKETVLRNNLMILRMMIDEYTSDKKKAPQSLDDLVQGGYLTELPKDPMTDSSGKWLTTIDISPDNQDQPGIFDVHSSSDQIGLDGTPYSDW